jgi:SAM-dependent methyltransferase
MTFMNSTDAKSMPKQMRPDFGLTQRGRAGLEILGAMQKFSSATLREIARARFETSAEGRALSEQHAADRAGTGVKERLGKAVAVAERDPAYRMERFIQRYVAEENFHRAIPAIEERRAGFEAFLQTPVDDVGGSLELMDGIEGPAYWEKTNWHLEPGGWDGYDLYGPVFAYGIGPLVFRHGGYAAVGVGDDIVDQRLRAIRMLPKTHYERIYEPGCGGGSTLLAANQVFPEAELYGCDLSSTLLKMADFVARQRGVPIHLRQRELTRTGEADDSMDAVVTYALHHELAPKDNVALFREMFRIMKPDADLLLVDPPPFRAVSMFHSVILDWDTKHRDEPFFTVTALQDWESELRKAGFVDVHSSAIGRDSYPWVIQARKPALG